MGALIVERGGRSNAVLSQLRSMVKGMDRMIDQLLSFARARTGAIELARRPVALVALCREVIGEMALLYPRRAICLGPACDEVCGDWDPDRLAQVARNLLSNALTHGDRRSPVLLAIRDVGAAAELSVESRGKPIPPELRAHLFEAFRRGGPGTGAGLGLYIVDQIARAHGGSVELSRRSAEPDCGSVDAGGDAVTVFTVRLPKSGSRDRFNAAEEPDARVRPAVVATTGTAMRRKPPRTRSANPRPVRPSHPEGG
jgi:signal transduction histidine kinase